MPCCISAGVGLLSEPVSGTHTGIVPLRNELSAWNSLLNFSEFHIQEQEYNILDLFCAFPLLCDRYSDDNSGNMTHASEFSPQKSVLIISLFYFYNNNYFLLYRKF